MPGVSVPDLVDRLVEEVALWCTTPGVGQEQIVRLACDAVVAGIDGPAMVDLAGQSSRGRDGNFRESAASALQEQGLAFPGVGTPEAQRGALRAMSRRCLSKLMSERELAAWAHRVIGHEGVDEGRVLVECDDEYDIGEYAGGEHRPAGIDERVRAEATRLVSTRP